MKDLFKNHLNLFDQFSQIEIDELYALGNYKSFKKGELLSKPDDKIEFGFFLAKGIAANYYITEENKKIVSKFSRAPELMTITLPNLFLDQPTNLYTEAITNIEGRILQKDALLPYAAKHPKLFKIIIARFLQVIKDNQFNLINQNALSATKSYRHFLSQYRDIESQIPSNYIASYLGIEPGSLSRIRKNINQTTIQ